MALSELPPGNDERRFTFNDATSDPVHSARVRVGDSLRASDLKNVHRWHTAIGVACGLLLASLLLPTGLHHPTLTAWISVPATLFRNAMLCLIFPTVLMNSVLASMHFCTLNKAKALGYKLAASFLASSVWASVIGTLVAVSCAPTFTPSNLRTTVNPVTLDKTRLVLRCRDSGSVVVFSAVRNSLRCDATEANGTEFLFQDLSGALGPRSTQLELSQHRASISTLLIDLLRRLFPFSIVETLASGDVLGVILVGAALGMALVRVSGCQTREMDAQDQDEDDDDDKAYALEDEVEDAPGMVFLLVMQLEVILSVLLRFLLKVLPVAIAFMVAAFILQGNTHKDNPELVPSMRDLITVGGVMTLASAIHVGTVLALVMFTTKSNPLPFLVHLIPAQLVALGSSSSLVALPTTVRSIAATKQISMPLAHFVCSMGVALNKTGSAIYFAVTTIFVLRTASVDVSTSAVVALAMGSLLASWLVLPLPRSHLALLSSLFTIAGVGLEPHDIRRLVMFVTAMDWVCDPLATVVSVTVDCLIAWMLAVQMDEQFIAHGATFDPDGTSDTQEEGTDDGLTEDGTRDSERRHQTISRGSSNAVRSRHDRMSSIGESEVSV
ncbi:hypothetical protein PINS_up009444 [Pythium insidiosum]|nr:hypothetical protein PINS_up009444 [Pythium insidiosum]